MRCLVTPLGDEARKHSDVESDRKVVAFEVHDVGHERPVVADERRLVVSHPRLVADEGGGSPANPARWTPPVSGGPLAPNVVARTEGNAADITMTEPLLGDYSGAVVLAERQGLRLGRPGGGS